MNPQLQKTLEDANSFQKDSIEVPSSPRNLEVNKDSGIRSKTEKLGIDNAHSFTAHRPSPTQMFVDQKIFYVLMRVRRSENLLVNWELT